MDKVLKYLKRIEKRIEGIETSLEKMSGRKTRTFEGEDVASQFLFEKAKELGKHGELMVDSIYYQEKQQKTLIEYWFNASNGRIIDMKISMAE